MGFYPPTLPHSPETSLKWDGFPTHGSGEAWLPLSRTADLVSTRDPPALAPAPPGPPVGLGSLEIQGHPDPDLSPRGGTAARSFAPDSARIGPRFQQNPPNSFSSAPCGTSGSLNRIEDRKSPRPSDGPDLCGLQSSPRLGQAPKTKNKHKMRLLRCPLPSSR